MKRLFTLLLISFAALSCEMIDEKLDDLLNKRDWVVFADGTELTVDVSSKQTVLNYKFESTLDWKLTTESEWLEIDPTSGKAGKDIKIKIKVLHNKDKVGRTGYVDLTLSNEESYRITVNQAGEENEDIIVDIPNNQIWYTSIDGEVVEPYSGEDNEYAEAITTFGVNIVSNTYVDGKGVIEFEGDVTTIGDWAFAFCTSLTSIIIPDSVTTIERSTFRGCSSLTGVTIPDSVTTIGYCAFYRCSSLTSVTIPDSVTTIGDVAFQGCSSLTSVTLSDNLILVGYGAFLGCDNLAEFKGKFVSEDDRCLIIDGTLYSFASAGLISYSIPDGVTTIGWYAFAYCSELISVTIPDSVVSIGYGAFESCTSITSITIPDSVILIEEGAFWGCSSLTSVTIPDSVTSIGWDAFSDCINLMEFKGESVSEDGRCVVIDGELCAFAPAGITEYILPENVTIIGKFVFSSCNNLTSVTIPDSVTTIGDEAFIGCSSLTSVTIGDNVTMIGSQAFYDCDSLTNVTIPDSVTTIGYGAFESCSSLTSVTIGDSVTTIGEEAFYDCDSLTSVYINDIAAWCNISFGNYDSNPLCDAHNLYLNNELVTDLTIPDSVTTIGNYAFYVCESLTSVTIPDSVTTIGIYAFYYCSSLTSVTIPDSVTTIGNSVFNSCSSLTSVYCKATTPPSLGGGSVFNNNGSGRKIYVPMESVEAYKSEWIWSEYASDIEGYNF